MSTIARLLERVTDALEKAEVLDRPPTRGSSSPAGSTPERQGLLSGTAVGHPLHPGW